MPFTWTLDAESRLVRFAWVEPYTFTEWLKAMTEVVAHPAFAPGYRFLVDRRHASAPSSEFITNMASFGDVHRALMNGVRAALVVGDDAGFGMARMTELTATGRNPTMTVRVFRDVPTAERWLLTSAESA